MTELPVSPRTKRDYRAYLNLCAEWQRELDDPAPFDEWEQQLAREMDRKRAERAGDRHE